MKLPGGVRRLLRLREPGRDVADELSFHFEHAVAELRSEGLSEAAARREAERRFGDVIAYRRELESMDRGRARSERRVRRWGALRDVAADGARSVGRSPALSAAVVLTLALGLGANATMYGIIDRLLLSPPPHLTEPEQVRRVMVEQYVAWTGERSALAALSHADFADLTAATSLADAAVWQEQWLTLGHGTEARQLDGSAVSGSYFALRGVRPALGRLLSAEDDATDAERAAVISHALWQGDYGGAPDVLGRTLDFGTATYTIVGVAPRGLTSLRLARVDVWLPLRQAVSAQILEGRGWYGFGGVVRLRDGVADAAAMEELSLLLRRGRAEQIAAGTYDADARVLLTPVLEARGPQARPETAVAKWLAGVSLIVLLIACVNVANLLLARVVRQRREIAVRLALGISRRRLVGQILLEGALLGVLGGAAALLVARWAGAAVSALLLPDVAWRELGWSPLLLPVTLALAVCAGCAAALVPAVQASRPGLADTLRQAAGSGTRATARTRAALSLVQAALAVVLLVGAGLFVRSLDAVRSVDLGFRLDEMLYLETSFVPGTTTPEERRRIGHDVVERLRTHPAVAAAAAANMAPFAGSMGNNVRLPGRDSLPLIGSANHWMYTVSADYFDALGIRILRGRAFDEHDVRTGANVALVGETMARTFWPEGDALGACMFVGRDTTDCTFVVGVVPDTKQRYLQEEGSAQYFLPLTPQHDVRVVLVRPRPRIDGAQAALRAAVAAIDPRIRLVTITAASERFAPQERSWRLGATLFSAFGLLALVVAALGLYAVLAFDVSQRTREIGIRGALGAGRRSILTLVVAQALKVAAAGVALGVAAAALLAPRVEEMLFEVGPHDPLTYGVAAATLLVAAVAAAMLPASRAAAVDPARALRAE